MVCTATPPAVYRPRRPREPTLYRLINSHYEDFQRVYAQRYQRRYGYWRPAIGEAVRRFLRRSGCRVCPRTLSRLPSRNLRGLLVPPTMPLPELSSKALADLRRPGGSRNLCPGPPPAICVYHSQATTNLLSFRPPPAGKVDAAGVGDDERGALLDRDDVVPGMIAGIQTFGTLAHFHPHVHAIVTDGVFVRDTAGRFICAPPLDMDKVRRLWEARVFHMLLEAGKIDLELVEPTAGRSSTAPKSPSATRSPNRPVATCSVACRTTFKSLTPSTFLPS